MPIVNYSVPLIDEFPTVNIDSPHSIITIGTDGNDSLTGTEQTDVIDGRDGNDQISGLSKDDAISGNEGNDIINGDEGNDILFGHQGDDIVSGGAGEDVIVGVDPGSGFGTSEKDSLRGDEGEDTFVLGDQNRVYYVDNDPTSVGEEDYGLIVDFTVGEDSIELNGNPDNYLLDFYTTSDGKVNADIVYDPGLAARGELIAILEDVSADLKLTDSSFIYEENDYAVLYDEIFEPLQALEPGTYGTIGSIEFTNPGGGSGSSGVT
nr:calcium-binding protein [Crocosphaera sp.]